MCMWCTRIAFCTHGQQIPGHTSLSGESNRKLCKEPIIHGRRTCMKYNLFVPIEYMYLMYVYQCGHDYCIGFCCVSLCSESATDICSNRKKHKTHKRIIEGRKKQQPEWKNHLWLAQTFQSKMLLDLMSHKCFL